MRLIRRYILAVTVPGGAECCQDAAVGCAELANPSSKGWVLPNRVNSPGWLCDCKQSKLVWCRRGGNQGPHLRGAIIAYPFGRVPAGRFPLARMISCSALVGDPRRGMPIWACADRQGLRIFDSTLIVNDVLISSDRLFRLL